MEDNPRLNIRRKGLKQIINKVCLLDPSGRSLDLISKSRLARVRPIENILVITSRSVSKKNYSFKVLRAPLNANKLQFDLKSLGFHLYQEKIGSVLIEGGAKTFSSFLEQNAVQRLYQFINPCLLGGLKGRCWTEDLSTKSLNFKKRLKFKEVLFFDEDLLITGIF